MPKKAKLQFDTIGYWSEVKLDIIKDYAQAYSQILSKQSLKHVYIDAFAGAGQHISKKTGGFIPGSPSIALSIQPPFHEYHFIDLNPHKVAELEKIKGQRKDVFVYHEDCNQILTKDVFPRALYKDYKRRLCLLDPYGLHLNWEVIYTAGQMKTIDMFLNFPVADMNRNVIWKNPDGVDPADLVRMNKFWGDESWKKVAYSTDKNLFGYLEKEDNEVIAEGFKLRLNKVAGFKYISDPLPMRNSNGATIYYLFFASQQKVAYKIIKDIFNKYKDRGVI
jgi:three-Cys-motif partner protein